MQPVTVFAVKAVRRCFDLRRTFGFGGVSGLDLEECGGRDAEDGKALQAARPERECIQSLDRCGNRVNT